MTADVAKEAFKNGGLVYGGFVRDFLVAKTRANDVDIWFKSVEDVERCIECLKDKGYTISNVELQTSNILKYRFYRKRCKVSNNGVSFYVDFVINEEFPVYDFLVNRLVYNGKEVSHVSGDELSLEETIDLVKRKVMGRSKEYYYLEDSPVYPMYKHRIESFRERGWNTDIIEWEVK